MAANGMPPGNWLLNALPADELARLGPLQARRVALNEVFNEAGDNIEYAYFPTTSLISASTILNDGGAVEAFTIGREGMSGLPLAFGVSEASVREMGEIPGEAIRVPARAIREALPSSPRLRELLGHYADATMKQLAQTVACNRGHQIEQRCARWLLLTQDQMASDRFALTHEVLSYMLGTNRPTVTLALQQLRKAGLIDYTRGAVAIRDRVALELVSCECYVPIRARFQAYRKLLGVADVIPPSRLAP